MQLTWPAVLLLLHTMQPAATVAGLRLLDALVSRLDAALPAPDELAISQTAGQGLVCTSEKVLLGRPQSSPSRRYCTLLRGHATESALVTDQTGLQLPDQNWIQLTIFRCLLGPLPDPCLPVPCS